MTATQLNPSANVPGTFVFDPPIGHLLNSGSDHVLIAAFAPQDMSNYLPVTASNLITVTKTPLVIAADDKTKVFGQVDPPLTASYGGFVNGETAVDLDTAVILGTSATTSSPVGVYPIIAAGASDDNYQITFTDGILTIEPNAQLNSIVLEPGGQVRIRFTGLSGRAYRVEVSGNLSDWETAGTVQPDANGDGEFLESAVPVGAAARFYRLAWP